MNKERRRKYTKYITLLLKVDKKNIDTELFKSYIENKYIQTQRIHICHSVNLFVDGQLIKKSSNVL